MPRELDVYVKTTKGTEKELDVYVKTTKGTEKRSEGQMPWLLLKEWETLLSSLLTRAMNINIIDQNTFIMESGGMRRVNNK